MTDYASQGKTWPFNVVDLHKVNTPPVHVYMSSHAVLGKTGTIILQGLSEGLKLKITKGASGALRQEFWELELLDEIMWLRFEGELHRDIQGITCSDLLASYRSHRGLTYVPQNIHRAL